MEGRTNSRLVLVVDEETPILRSNSSRIIQHGTFPAPTPTQGESGESEGGLGTHIVYKRRWYILIVYSLLACVQSGLCNIWTTMAESSEVAFGWSNADLSSLTIWLYMTYLVGMAPFAWLMQTKGMRVSVSMASTLVFLGTLARIISSTPPLVTWMANVGHICNGLAGPVLFGGSAILSSLWFPPDQRATATAIASMMGIAGSALVFILDPNVVPAPKTEVSQALMAYLDTGPHANVTNIPEIKRAFMLLRYGEFAVAAVLMLMTLIYFPAKPPTPPSTSAATASLPYWKGVKKIFSLEKINFWYAAIPACLAPGLLSVFSGLLDVDLKGLNIPQKTVGWINFYSMIGSCFCGLLLGRLADKFLGYRKLILMVCAAFGALGAFGAVLIVGLYIPFNIVGLYVSLIVLGVSVNGALPLYYETCIEATYPIPESVTMAVIIAGYSVFPIVFLLVFFIPNVGTSWMNWFLYVSLVLCCPILALFKERYDRLSLDVPITN